MSNWEADLDARSMVIVPKRPGALRRLGDLDRDRDDVDELLDEIFGQTDDRGPGLVDGVLVAGGAAAFIAAQVTSLPTAVGVCGVAAVALGAVLPLRSLWRRAASSKRKRHLRSLVGDGTVLRTDHANVGDLVAAHDQLLASAAALGPAPRARVEDVAHSAVLEVATMLGGRRPTGDIEVEYVTVRTVALRDLATTVRDPQTGDGDPDRRRALLDARLEVERLGGTSSVTAAADLSRELKGRDGA